jgi:hypothetical protein
VGKLEWSDEIGSLHDGRKDGNKIDKMDAKLHISSAICRIIDTFHDNLASESCESAV